jgi:DNA repair and recombination RAD54-like protein
MILKRRNRGEAVPEQKLLKKPRTIYISDDDEDKEEEEEEEEEEQVFSHTNVANASPSSSSEDELDNEDDDSEFSDSEDEGTVTRRPVLNNLTNKSSLRCYQPLARIPKNYDPKSILTKKFKIPTMSNNNNSLDNGNIRRTLGIRRRAGHLLRALYDHTAADALVLWDPDKAPVQKENKVEEVVKKKKEKSLSEILGLKKEEAKQVHVTVDPIVSRVLRPHQVEGVKFLFNCTTEKVEPGAFGCIMADEMGLGKTVSFTSHLIYSECFDI